MSAFVVGIDLGTSHTVVASAPRDIPTPEVTLFEIDQRVAVGQREARVLLPSCLYAPLEQERDTAAQRGAQHDWIAGAFAQRRGTEVPSRFVLSSKSWLSHARVDRRAAILPWGQAEEDEPDLPRLSPVDAARLVLEHVRNAWNAAHPNALLAEQDVILTVPASFDAVARELTVEAALAAGLRPRLLEEPLAAFYNHLHVSGGAQALHESLRDPSGAESTVLVVDVGGGTTDLSLLGLRSTGSEPSVRRIAVGAHLLLGGDNIDLALAHLCESRLKKEGRLRPRQFAELTYRCRAAKEALLAEQGPASLPITLLASGSQLVGGAMKTDLTREEVENVLAAFMPEVRRGEKPPRQRGGLVAFGLPYERDVAITRHVTQFLERFAPDAAPPHAILFNGGVFRAPMLAARLADVVAQWGEESDAPRTPRLLGHEAPDTAVATGAARFGLALYGHGLRISAGSPRGYYVGVADKSGRATKAICVVPRGSAEGERHVAQGRELALVVGKAARFELFTKSDVSSDVAGDVIEIGDSLDALPPMTTRLSAGDDAAASIVVLLEGELSAVGTVELACREAHPSEGKAAQRFRLAFELESDTKSSPPSKAPGPASKQGRAAHLDDAIAAINRVYGKDNKSEPRDAKALGRELDKLLGERSQWSLETLRSLGDALLTEQRARKRSADHERIWWQLVGYCLRPGFGHPDDGARVGKVVPLLPERLAYSKEVRGWQQLWIAWRRLAGGFNEKTQTRLRNELDPFVAPAEKKLKKPKGARPDSLDNMLEMLATLERVPPARRAELGNWIIERTWTDRDPKLWAALGKLGARVPAYASEHHATSASVAERWLDHLLREKWSELSTAPRAALQLARCTGDRSRDVAERTRERVALKLEEAGAPAEWAAAVRGVVEIERSDHAAFFGDDLPIGLVLVS